MSYREDMGVQVIKLKKTFNPEFYFKICNAFLARRIFFRQTKKIQRGAIPRDDGIDSMPKAHAFSPSTRTRHFIRQ